jgi:diphthamide synthase subunit DPH2
MELCPTSSCTSQGGAEKYSFATPTTTVVLDQKGCLFQHHVLGIMVRQELRVLSSDPTTHNVHAMAKQNRECQTQLPGGAPLSKSFA